MVAMIRANVGQRQPPMTSHGDNVGQRARQPDISGQGTSGPPGARRHLPRFRCAPPDQYPQLPDETAWRRCQRTPSNRSSPSEETARARKTTPPSRVHPQARRRFPFAIDESSHGHHRGCAPTYRDQGTPRNQDSEVAWRRLEPSKPSHDRPLQFHARGSATISDLPEPYGKWLQLREQSPRWSDKVELELSVQAKVDPHPRSGDACLSLRLSTFAPTVVERLALAIGHKYRLPVTAPSLRAPNAAPPSATINRAPVQASGAVNQLPPGSWKF